MKMPGLFEKSPMNFNTYTDYNPACLRYPNFEGFPEGLGFEHP
jgi:hypothetical protein